MAPNRHFGHNLIKPGGTLIFYSEFYSKTRFTRMTVFIDSSDVCVMKIFTHSTLCSFWIIKANNEVTKTAEYEVYHYITTIQS